MSPSRVSVQSAGKPSLFRPELCIEFTFLEGAWFPANCSQGQQGCRPKLQRSARNHPSPSQPRIMRDKSTRRMHGRITLQNVSWGPSFPNSRPHVTPRTPKSRTCSHNQESAQAKAIPHRTKHFRPFPPQTTGSPKTRFRTAWKTKSKANPA